MKNKYIIKAIRKILILIILIITFIFFKSISEMICYDYVEELGEECYGIRYLDDFVNYNMLSSKYKKQIEKKNFNFKSDEDIWFVCQKFQSVTSDYNYHKSDYSTHSLRHNPLCAQIEIDDVVYNVVFDITFAPRIFSLKPKIVNWSINIAEVQTKE